MHTCPLPFRDDKPGNHRAVNTQFAIAGIDVRARFHKSPSLSCETLVGRIVLNSHSSPFKLVLDQCSLDSHYCPHSGFCHHCVAVQLNRLRTQLKVSDVLLAQV
eukprot:862313-Amphidinium_carterae.2